MTNRKIPEKHKVVFMVTYNPPIAVKISEFLSKMDLGLEGIQYPICEKWSWTTKTKIDKKYIKTTKTAIKKAIESFGGKLIGCNNI